MIGVGVGRLVLVLEGGDGGEGGEGGLVQFEEAVGADGRNEARKGEKERKKEGGQLFSARYARRE